MSSYSITPPLSPAEMVYEDLPPSPKIPRLEDDPIEMFSCQGETGCTYWRSGFLNRLISDQGQGEGRIGPDKVTLFDTESKDVRDTSSRLPKLFMCLKQKIGSLHMEEEKCRKSFVKETDVDCDLCREQVCGFLDHILMLVQSRQFSGEDILVVLEELRMVVLYIGRMSDLPSYMLDKLGLGSKSSPAYQSFHLHLDVYWRTLAVIHTIQICYPEVKVTSAWCMTLDHDLESSLYDQLLSYVLWDLVYLANARYSNASGSTDLAKECLFACSCVRELWLQLLTLTQWRSNHINGESFWINVHHVLKTLLDKDVNSTEQVMEMEDCQVIINPPGDVDVEDPVGLCMWTMYHVSLLYTENSPAMEDSGKALSNYHDLQSIVKKLLASPGLQETTLRRHMRLVLQITANWEPNVGILVTLWEYFSKRLSETFQEHSSRIDGLACMDQTVLALYDRCHQYTQGLAECLDKETSYQLFLRLLSTHLGNLYSSGSVREWKQVKGRIYSKFHMKRLRDLSDGGLYNLSALFITLGMTADLEDVASKLVAFYDMLDIPAANFARRGVVWRGVLTLMLVYVHRDLDIGFLADRMAISFDAAVSDFREAFLDRRHNLWKLILTYMEGCQEIIDASRRLALSEHKLLGASIKTFLSLCSEHELRTCLSLLHTMLQKFRQVKCVKDGDSSVNVALQHADFSSVLWKHVYSFVVDHAQTLTPPDQIGDIAASFCLLSLAAPPVDGTTTVQLFQYFAASEKVNANVSCRFLGHLLSNTEVQDHLSTHLEHQDSWLISAWFRCALLVLPGGKLQEITRPILQLKEVRSIFQSAELDGLSDLDLAPVTFLKAIGKAQLQIQSWQERMEYQRQVSRYFADVPKHVTPVAKSLSPGDVVSNVYKMTGNLVKYCGKLLYVQQDVLIPSLLSILIVPHSVFNPDKPLSPVFLGVIREHLHLFMQGLEKLAYDRDPFIQRRLKDIVTVFLPKFTLKSSVSMVTAVHPVVASLRGSFIQQPSADSVQFRHHIVNIVITNYLAVRNMKIHQSYAQGFSFLYEVVQRTTSTEVKARDLPQLFPICLEYLLLLAETDNSWNLILTILQDLSSAHRGHSEVLPLSNLVESCARFVGTYFKFSSTGVIRLLEKTSVMLPNVVVAVIGTMSENIREIERKRGVGVDHKLREKYVHVLKLLGDEGQAEIERLRAISGISDHSR